MENQRIRLSKKMLKSALMELLKKKPVEKISIYELCETAQINRTTFYKYYGNQYDLLSDIENDIFEKFEEQLRAYNDSSAHLHHVLDLILSDKENFITLINSVPDQEFSGKLFSLHTVRAILNAQFPEKYNERQREYMYLFICQGSYAIIRKWLNDGVQDSTEMVAELIHDLAGRTLIFQEEK